MAADAAVGPVRTMTGRRQRLSALRRIDRDAVDGRIWLQAEWYRRLLLDFEAVETALKRVHGAEPARPMSIDFSGSPSQPPPLCPPGTGTTCWPSSAALKARSRLSAPRSNADG